MTSTRVPQVGGEQAVLARPLRQRRRSGLMAAGLLLVVLGAMAVWLLVTRAGGTQQVVLVRHAVARGGTITSADVAVVDAVRGTTVAVVPGDKIDDVVGQVAQVELRPDRLLGPDDYGPALPLPPGKAFVDVIPGPPLTQDLHAGDRVHLVLAGTAQADVPENLQVWNATVVRTGKATGTSGETSYVRVEVPVNEADAVMAASASGRLVLGPVNDGSK